MEHQHYNHKKRAVIEWLLLGGLRVLLEELPHWRARPEVTMLPTIDSRQHGVLLNA